MKKIQVYVVALCMALAASVSWAKDVYDWRAKTEGICAQSFSMLERQISGYMVGGRPENLVIGKLKDAAPIVQELGEIDAATAQIVIKSLVHSFFTDPELRQPIYTIKSIQRARMACSADVVRYDPDGGKAEAYSKIKSEEQGKQQKENEAKASEEGRIQQEENEASQERDRQQKAEEKDRQQKALAKNRAEAAERKKQHDAAINNMLKNTRTDEGIAKDEAERKQKEEDAKKANSGVGGLIKSLW